VAFAEEGTSAKTRGPAYCPLGAPHIEGISHINSSSECRRNPTLPPSNPATSGQLCCPVATKFPPLHATCFPTSCHFNPLLPNKPYKQRAPTSFPTAIQYSLQFPSSVLLRILPSVQKPHPQTTSPNLIQIFYASFMLSSTSPAS